MRGARDFWLGVRLYGRGVALWRTRPGLAALGLVPGLVTAWLFVLGFVLLVATLGAASGAIASWVVDEGALHDLIQVAAALALVGGALVLSVIAFVSVTATLGQPVYEAIARRVDESLGPVEDAREQAWWRSLARGAADGAQMLALGVAVAATAAFVGLLPVLGAALAWIVGAGWGGWLLAVEFTAVPFERRGYSLRQRREALHDCGAVAVGFGVSAFIASSFAPLAVLTMPLSVAGGVHLARHALDEADATGR